MADSLKVIAALESDTPPDDTELNKAVEALKGALDAATKGDNVDLEIARDLRAALDSGLKAQTERAEQRAKDAEEAAKLRGDLFPEPEPEVEDEAKPEAEVKVEEKQPEPVAASSTADVIARLTRAASRIAPVTDPEPVRNNARLRPVGPASGYELAEDDGFQKVGEVFSTYARSLRGRTPLVTLTREYNEDRKLTLNKDLNDTRLAAVFGADRPVTAAGGICGPGEHDFTHKICPDRGRPVRDALVQFGASRGKITYSPALGLGDLTGATSIWTAAIDANPGAATKPCPHIDCPSELTCEVDAITACLTVGNFQAKFNPEWWAANLQLLGAIHDRMAEQKALQEIHAASTVLPAVNEGNTLASFLMAVNAVISSDRSINRNIVGGYTVIADAWLRDAIRNQVIYNLGVANNVDAIQIADQQISGWLSTVNARVVWTEDGTVNPTGGTHNVITTPGAFLPTSTLYVFTDDSFLFLDGGTLDLGTDIHDSALNATNDRQAFWETFEKVCFRGCSAYAVPITVAELCGCAPVAP